MYEPKKENKLKINETACIDINEVNITLRVYKKQKNSNELKSNKNKFFYVNFSLILVLNLKIIRKIYYSFQLSK